MLGESDLAADIVAELSEDSACGVMNRTVPPSDSRPEQGTPAVRARSRRAPDRTTFGKYRGAGENR